MKSLKRAYNSTYDNEVGSLEASRGLQGVIRYLGSFQHQHWLPYDCDEASSTGDYMSSHILFEYGDGDLLKFFEFSPPSYSSEVQEFWRDLTRVVEALAEIQDIKKSGQSIGMYVHVILTLKLANKSRIHADIKPDNIISVGGNSSSPT